MTLEIKQHGLNPTAGGPRNPVSSSVVDADVGGYQLNAATLAEGLLVEDPIPRSEEA
ncbi:MAG: hypothetical protein ABSH35_36275 [Isosphaeraceae bacterium]